MLKNEKEKFVLSIIIVLICSGLLIWQGIININNDIENTLSDLKDKKITKEALDLKDKTLEQEQQDYDFSRKKIEKINNYFVYASDNDDTEFTSFFGQLDAMASKSTGQEDSLTIDLVQSGPTTEKNIKKTSSAKESSSNEAAKEDSRSLKLTLKSDFQGLMNFISRIEAMPYYVYIESVSTNTSDRSAVAKKIDKNTPADDSIDLQSIIVIKVFRKTNIL